MSAVSPLPLDGLVAEAQRVLSICNACRYCEGYCAVFPALERRLAFDEGDIHYLANLCHNCGSCLYACQYAPPHEFQLNFPRLLAQVRKQTYRKYAWPEALGTAFERNGIVTGLMLAASIALVFVFTAWYARPERLFAAWSDAQGSFYAVLPHNVMAGVFGFVALFVLIAFLMSFTRFWPDMGEETVEFMKAPSLSSASWDALGLRYLDGGGEGCTYPDARPSFARRTYHHFTFYGFTLCLAATTVATIYHYVFGWKAPYPMYSLPVLLGIFGGIGLVVGPIGLLALRARRDPQLVDESQSGMDAGFLVLLLLVSVTGLALLFLRESRAMGVLLALHLGVVLALFLTLPYGKFVHALYRFAALVRFHIERRRPLPEIGSE
ncbi:MAG TPA: tricarballylate utilization 4Fe-4S protein TcuB [Usitatibacter sp.]|nr:tricarballylate utilization 4Fe-4S protein TcuB [Usitatibacter sp.]